MTKNNIIEWQVEGMTCNNCAANISTYLQKQGLDEVEVNFAVGKVSFRKPESAPALSALEDGVRNLGFQVLGTDQNERPTTARRSWTLKEKLLVSAVFTIPLFVYHFLMMAGIHWAIMENPWTQLALCLPVYLIGFWHFGRSAFYSLRGGSPNMDVLIFMGSTAAFIYSVIGLVLNEPNYIFFETAATIITLVLLGNWIEHQAVKQTTTAIEDLAALQPAMANRILASGKTESVKTGQLHRGDSLQINEGDKVPADSRLVSGVVSVDESMISGESIPVDKKPGDALIGGTVIVGGNCRAEVTATGKASVLAQIIKLVEQAQQDKPEIQRLADRASAIFVPLVLCLALAAVGLGYWILDFPLYRSVLNGIAVLVISCPCAMGLATPTAVMVGVGRLAKNGILIKGGRTVEVLTKIKHFVFDKTGTLTTGEFQLKGADYKGISAAEANAIAYKMEQTSSHPVARSLIKELEDKVDVDQLPQLSVEEKKGFGLMAVDDKLNRFQMASDPSASNGLNSITLTRNQEVLATFALGDELRPKVSQTIAYLKENGRNPILLSGDKKQRVGQLADKIGIDRYYGEQTPTEKLAFIDELTAKAPTAMVGDGINDAPALARATLGISLSNASEVAIQSAQVVLLNGQVSQLTKALDVSNHTVLTIKQNLFWAFAYNIVAIPIAAIGLLNPMFGALFMAISDVVVIGNSIRLKYKKIGKEST